MASFWFAKAAQAFSTQGFELSSKLRPCGKQRQQVWLVEGHALFTCAMYPDNGWVPPDAAWTSTHSSSDVDIELIRLDVYNSGGHKTFEVKGSALCSNGRLYER